MLNEYQLSISRTTQIDDVEQTTETIPDDLQIFPHFQYSDIILPDPKYGSRWPIFVLPVFVSMVTLNT